VEEEKQLLTQLLPHFYILAIICLFHLLIFLQLLFLLLLLLMLLFLLLLLLSTSE
jgi:hypothetical protein